MNESITDAPMMDPLDEKLTTHFPGRMVPKDLVRQTRTVFNVPVYVQYLLGNYCSSTDVEIIAEGCRSFAIRSARTTCAPTRARRSSR